MDTQNYLINYLILIFNNEQKNNDDQIIYLLSICVAYTGYIVNYLLLNQV